MMQLDVTKEYLDRMCLERGEQIAVKRYIEFHGRYQGHDGKKLTVAYLAGPSPSDWVEIDCQLDQLRNVRRFKEEVHLLFFPRARRSSDTDGLPEFGEYPSFKPLFRRESSRSLPWSR